AASFTRISRTPDSFSIARPAPPTISPLSLHDALPICDLKRFFAGDPAAGVFMAGFFTVMMFGLPAACLAMYRTAPEARTSSPERTEEHTSELQSRGQLVCRLPRQKKKATPCTTSASRR